MGYPYGSPNPHRPPQSVRTLNLHGPAHLSFASIPQLQTSSPMASDDPLSLAPYFTLGVTPSGSNFVDNMASSFGHSPLKDLMWNPANTCKQVLLRGLTLLSLSWNDSSSYSISLAASPRNRRELIAFKGPSSMSQRQNYGGNLVCFIGLSGRGVENMDLSLPEARMISEEAPVKCGLVEDQSFSVPKEDSCIVKLEKKSKKASWDLDVVINTGKHLLAGAISAVVSRTFVAPLERLKLEYMVCGAHQDVLQIVWLIAANEGVGGFWRGNVVNLLRTAPFKAVNFFCYDLYRKKILEWTAREEVSNFERLVAGAAAGISATLLCFPMDTIRTRLVAPGGECLGGVVGCFRHMVETEGLFSLYKGLLPSVISMAPSGAVFYGVYDILKTTYLQSPEGQEDLRRRIEMERERRHSERKMLGNLKEEAESLGQLELGPIRTLLYGAIAGICAETVTYPFEVVRRQLQMQNAATKMSALATCRVLVQERGLGALYSGLLPSSLQVLPSAALSYFVYECMKIILKVS